MGNSQAIRCCKKPSEEGYLLLSVMFLMAILVLWLSVAVPRMTKSIQRDREVETMHRGKQYIRALQLYYRKFGAYPPSQDALVKTNDIRFLRKKYIDPTTGKDDWKPILFGQNKVATAMGFFGQPLSAGGSIAGIGPSGGNAGSTGSNGSSGSLFGNSPSGPGYSPPGGPTTGTSDNSGASTPTSGSTDNSGTSNSGTSTDNSGTSAGSSTPGAGPTGQNSGTASGSGPTGQSFGGAGIIGFSPASPNKSILVYKKKDHYNEWEFTYDPLMDMKTMTGGNTGVIGQPAGDQQGAGVAPGTGPGTGTQTPNAPGATPGSGSNPPPPPDTPAPPQ
jgi:type II secretory pathway pseudopilin PulG